MARTDVVRDYGGISADDRRAERRRKLLEAGRRVWGEVGIAKVTVRGVCSACGLTPRYFYEHFANTEALIIAIASQVRDELFAALVRASLAEPGNLEHKLRAAFTAFLDLIADDPHVHRVFAAVTAGEAGLAQQRSEALDMVADLVLQYGPALLDVERASPADLRRGALFVVGGVNQLIGAWLRDPQESTGELAEICTRLCLATVNGGAALPSLDG
ncbi:TetR/AcrR family transcriptional regulator [Antrihabitans sp. YC2-6]|uniref:TetR/AcrR family transcriptional regulator n=1 Tax=Antrihabitans sp. YC2-6 TaxID=2799498 RepID=UPI0018F3BFA3|nr:TetR/AcrR family transcriptional regulator [Antrihabitans sp. YC2-6]MBJ8348341.1 TetR/AcrR family transcriptional regulator [Antrihabitans sp. YC2-6]